MNDKKCKICGRDIKEGSLVRILIDGLDEEILMHRHCYQDMWDVYNEDDEVAEEEELDEEEEWRDAQQYHADTFSGYDD